MQGGGAGEAQARGDQLALRLARHGPEGLRHRTQQGLPVLVTAGVQHHLGPAGLIGDHPAQIAHASVLHIHENSALGAAFPDAAALQIAGINDMGIFVQHLVLMHMAQRPVVIAFGDKILRGAGRIGGVAGLAVAGGVEHADVEIAGQGLGIGRRPVLGLLPLQKAAAVDGDAQGLQLLRLRPLHRKGRHIARQGDRAGDHVFRVVIAVDDEDRDFLPVQAREFAGEEQADGRVFPFAVIDVARDQHEGDALRDGGGDEIGKGVAAGLRKAPGDGLVFQGKAQQGAAQMQVGAMQEGEIHRSAQVQDMRTRGEPCPDRARAQGAIVTVPKFPALP